MTRWKEIPLRTAGEFWPGLSTRNGRLMRRMGELADCVNINIQPFDTMAKRNGMVRAFDERFAGVVCGLFAYTDNCGNEYLLVADQTGFTIKTPFSLPGFIVADCYPFDNFSGNDFSALDPLKWRNTGRYMQNDDNMMLATGVPVVEETNLQLSLNACARWFKDACSSSYQTQITFAFDQGVSAKQRIVQVIRGSGELDDFGVLFAVLDLKVGAAYLLRLMHRAADDTIVELARRTFNPAVDAIAGSMALAYSATTRVLSATITLGTAAAITLLANPIHGVADANLGLISALGLMQVESGAAPTDLAVAVIDGGPV